MLYKSPSFIHHCIRLLDENIAGQEQFHFQLEASVSEPCYVISIHYRISCSGIYAHWIVSISRDWVNIQFKGHSERMYLLCV